MPSVSQHCLVNIYQNPANLSMAYITNTWIESDGPSSYDVVASQPNCPKGMNVVEYMTLQTLMGGTERRLSALLTELGSTNINFSSESTAAFISHIALMAGPRGKTYLRQAHTVFRELNFCKRLSKEIESRLDAISTNWRDIYCMDMVLTLILRLYTFLEDDDLRTQTKRLVKRVQLITLNWIGVLKAKIESTFEGYASEKLSGYITWAAILCRRTFSHFVECRTPCLEEDELKAFIISSITLQEYLSPHPDSLSLTLRNALIKDVKLAYSIRDIVRSSLERYPTALSTSLTLTNAPSPESVLFKDELDDAWMEMTIPATEITNAQIVQYHYLLGHLFIDGEPLRQLPPQYRSSEIIKQLFGDQKFLTRPSGLHGMMYALTTMFGDYEIHIGFRNERQLFVRAVSQREILELIPRTTFVGNEGAIFDIPHTLIDKCTHWLNLETKILEIRHESDIWKSKPSNWYINTSYRTGFRNESRLIDPNKSVFKQIANIFDKFENKQQITVFQSKSNVIQVELRRLELFFLVSQTGLLRCRNLDADVDTNQDAGCWYGLNSKLVLRDIANPGRRSVLIPLGEMTYKRRGCHISIDLQNDGNYGRFVINDVLGRLECPVEPRLLYMKAQLFAYTSFTLPDTLTGRTGTEEARHCLRLGYCRPWQPLALGPANSLLAIAKVTPLRAYYPSGLRLTQEVTWDNDLTITIQDEELRPIVESILDESNQLLLFAESTSFVSFEQTGVVALSERALVRRRVYQRLFERDEKQYPRISYESRDGFSLNTKVKNVHHIGTIIRRFEPVKIDINLIALLQSRSTIGGYNHHYDRIVLSDCLSTNLTAQWGPLINYCKSCDYMDRYRLMFLFGLISFQHNINIDALSTIVQFAICSELRALQLPQWDVYENFQLYETPRKDKLKLVIKPFCKTSEKENWGSQNYSALTKAHDEKVLDDVEYFVEHLLGQWPCINPSIDGLKILLLDTDQAFATVLIDWKQLYRNFEFSNHIKDLQIALNTAKYRKPLLFNEWPEIKVKTAPLIMTGRFPIVGELVKNRPLYSLQNFLPPNIPRKESRSENSSHHTELATLKGILIKFKNQSIESHIREQYCNDLLDSLKALENLRHCNTSGVIVTDNLDLQIADIKDMLNLRLEMIRSALEDHEPGSRWLKEGGIWPCTSLISLLELLRTTLNMPIDEGIQQYLFDTACCVARLQHLLRIQDAKQKFDHQKLSEEVASANFINDAKAHSDWLLISIDADILVRKEQIQVAQAIIHPVSGSNSVLQMNMGRGKTSCVLPMAAASIADGKKLLRLIVPKSLLTQTAQILQSRLGGLVGRGIRHIPFSRRTSTNIDTIKAYHTLHTNALKQFGVILALPEHILSFKLSGLQRLLDNRQSEALAMIKVEDWTKRVCADILDESDFILAVRTQLIYPSGAQRTIDGQAQRWTTIEIILQLVKGHLPNVSRDFPKSIEVVWRSSQNGRDAERYPFVYFLRQDAEDALISRIVDELCSGSSILPGYISPENFSTIKIFITQAEIPPAITRSIHCMFPDKPSLVKSIYLLRGLIVHRILLLAFKKRWNVQYGIHPSRDPVAVPFLAKGVPSEQAEWGHPDVSIILTCLSFYYGGLEFKHFRDSLTRVLESDDPSIEYDCWVTGSSLLPNYFRDWKSINTEDEEQVHEFWGYVKYNTFVINNFLNKTVFPMHAKQFDTKIQVSGWDLPLTSENHLTTGFSGTNDNKRILPLTIQQDDLPELHHTNAEVLTYLLQKRNRKYVLAADQHGKRLSEIGLLDKMNTMGLNVLIDAGAQILEMDNFTLVNTWLHLPRIKAVAAVYFDTNNRAMVLFKKGRIVPFLATPFVNNLSDCLVYLDEAHTRGTDLRFPEDARAALTLGPAQTKDQIVQAAMRLRQLARGQSVVFFSTPEVHQSILDVCRKTNSGMIDSADVIYWLMEQTCLFIEQVSPLYFSQGMDYCCRSQTAISNPEFLSKPKQRKRFLKSLKQIEIETIEHAYEPKAKKMESSKFKSSTIKGYVHELQKQKKGFQNANSKIVPGSLLQEVEQEREKVIEIENIREKQNQVFHPAHTFPGLHINLEVFATKGLLPSTEVNMETVFDALKHTAVGRKYCVQSLPSKLLVSKEFMKTIKTQNDNFLRPVNWILTNLKTSIIVNPEEAECLIPLVRKSTKAYILTYAAPLTRQMMCFSDLRFYSTPYLEENLLPPPVYPELFIFAGALYFPYEQYGAIKDVLDNAFDQPLKFLHEWLAIRRNGQDFDNTPMGYICQSKSLEAGHHFFGPKHDSVESIESLAASYEAKMTVEYAPDEDEIETEEDDE